MKVKVDISKELEEVYRYVLNGQIVTIYDQLLYDDLCFALEKNKIQFIAGKTDGFEEIYYVKLDG